MGKVTKTFVDGQPLSAADLNGIKSSVNALYSDERAEVTDTNYVEAIDVNGNPVKLSKASMTKIVADIIKSTSTEQAKVTFGATTAAELSSVVAQQLGNPFGTRTETVGNIDTTISNGQYYYDVSTSGTKPSDSGVLNVYANAYGIIRQDAISNTGECFTRIQWGDYTQFSKWVRTDLLGAGIERCNIIGDNTTTPFSLGTQGGLLMIVNNSSTIYNTLVHYDGGAFRALTPTIGFSVENLSVENGKLKISMGYDYSFSITYLRMSL